MLTQAGINVVFSAGNNGPGANTLNPYAVAPWVVSVGATDTQGRLASFSSRGDFASALFHPTLVAPGTNVVSVRGSGVANVTGAQGVANADTARLNAAEIPYYTTASGTSFWFLKWRERSHSCSRPIQTLPLRMSEASSNHREHHWLPTICTEVGLEC